MKKMLTAAAALVSLFALTGCDPKAEFVGVYQASGTMTFELNGPNGRLHDTSTTNFLVEVLDGPDWDVVIPVAGGRCMLNAELKDGSATLKPNSSCNIIQDSVSTTFTFTSGTITRAGRNLQVQLTANIVMTSPNGSLSGTASETSTYARVSK